MTRLALFTWPYCQVVFTYCMGGDFAFEGCQDYHGRTGKVATVPYGEEFELRNDESLPARNGRPMNISFKAGPYARSGQGPIK